MSGRREWLLSLIHRSGGKIEGRTRLMKLAFLLDRAIEKKNSLSPFEFIAYKHGPFDKKVLNVLEDLDEEGILNETTNPTPQGQQYEYELTEKGEEKAETAYSELGFWDQRVLKGTLKRWKDKSTRTIIGYVYDNFPEYTQDD